MNGLEFRDVCRFVIPLFALSIYDGLSAGLFGTEYNHTENMVMAAMITVLCAIREKRRD